MPDLRTRRALLRAAVRAHDDALERNPDNARLRVRRAEIAHDLRGVAPPGDLETLRARLAEIEAETERGVSDPQRVRELLAARERLMADIHHIERWATPAGEGEGK